MSRTTLLSLFVALPLLGSCIAVAVGAAGAYGYIQYEENEAWADFDTSLGTTWDACLASVHALGYSLDGTPKLGRTEGEIQGEEINVRVERYPEDFTRVKIRVGTFDTADNRRRAMLLLEDIRERLE
jgi:hypothetical protein